MVSFKTSILVFVLTQASAANALLMSLDCSDEKNQSSAECICRYPTNRDESICQGSKWKPSDDVGIKIIGGEEVGANVYPWFARATLGSGWGGCGGSLVSPEYVLTAAHCVHGRINQLKNNGGYQIGALCSPYGPNLSGNCQQKVESFSINDIIEHPNYNNNNLDNDFALVRLNAASTITPVSMDQGNVSPGYENVSFKTNLWPIGFGTMDNGSVSSKLMHVNVNYVKQNTCKSQYGSSSITNNMMCASDVGQDSCQGDSGGPLFDSDSNKLVGVVSWGQGCADPNFAGVYARVSNQFTWIKETICSAHGDPKPAFCGGNPPSPPSNPPPPPSPTPPTTPPPSQCVDDPKDWHDRDGEFYNCEWYALGTNCQDYGDYYANFGKTANEACCACGGGNTGGGGPSPTPPPGPSPCPSGQKLLEVEVTTDNFGSNDNIFRVKKRVNGGQWTLVWKENNFENDTTETLDRCLPVNECYRFTMVDFFEDGMCCENGQGGYKVTWGGTVIKESEFRDGKFESVKFGNGC